MDRNDPHPQFGAQACGCGGRCGHILLVMLRPNIRAMEGTDDLACVVQFPIAAIEIFVEEMRRLAREAEEVSREADWF